MKKGGKRLENKCTNCRLRHSRRLANYVVAWKHCDKFQPDPAIRPPAMSNADRIRSMSDGELAEYIAKEFLRIEEPGRLELAVPAWMRWLQEPAKDGDGNG